MKTEKEKNIINMLKNLLQNETTNIFFDDMQGLLRFTIGNDEFTISVDQY